MRRCDMYDRRMTPSSGGLALEIVVPVFNESAILERSINRLADYLSRELLYRLKITIADNASTEATGAISRKLAHEVPNVSHRRPEPKGRGFALRDAWTSLIVLTSANGPTTLVRSVLLRIWVFRVRRSDKRRNAATTKKLAI
jgi:hypothetical protein